MPRILFSLMFILGMLLSACVSAASSPTAEISANPPEQTPAPPSNAPSATSISSTASQVPSASPALPSSTPGAPVIPPSGYEPQPADDKLQSDVVQVDMENSSVVVIPSQPAETRLELSGSLPDPCHELRVVVSPPDDKNNIKVKVYSVTDPTMICITVIKPFTATIPLGNYASGRYTVDVNDTRVGQFDTQFSVQPGDYQLVKGEVFLVNGQSKVLKAGEQLEEPAVLLVGNLPTPCNQLRIVLNPPAPDAVVGPASDEKINLDVYSVADTHTACIEMLQPFTVIFPLGSHPTGHYSVVVNGQLLGEFDA